MPTVSCYHPLFGSPICFTGFCIGITEQNASFQHASVQCIPGVPAREKRPGMLSLRMTFLRMRGVVGPRERSGVCSLPLTGSRALLIPRAMSPSSPGITPMLLCRPLPMVSLLSSHLSVPDTLASLFHRDNGGLQPVRAPRASPC